MSSATGLDQQRLLPAAIEASLAQLRARISGLLILACLAALWVAVITWSVTDPSLTHATSGGTRNALGTFGAIFSSLLLDTLGLAAAVALLAPMFWGLELLGADRVTEFRARAAYYPLSVLTAAGALSAMPLPASWPMAHGVGGILGDVLYSSATMAFGLINTERAGLAAGLLLSITAVSMLVQSLGLD